jgi:hypothetical protein
LKTAAPKNSGRISFMRPPAIARYRERAWVPLCREFRAERR